MRGRLGAAVAAAGVTVLLATAGCTAQPEADGDPTPSPSTSAPSSPSPTAPTLTLDDVSVSGTAMANRGGILLCGDRLVAAPPTSGIENNAFAVFDESSGQGEITHVELPADSGLKVNARWLLVMECVDNPEVTSDGPVLSFAYQEMPLPEQGGVGVRGAYSLEGQLLWMRDDINMPSELVDGLLVLGAAPNQPDLVVDAVTGETLRDFASPLRSQVVLNHRRMVVRRAGGGGPVLTDISGERVRKLRTSGSFFADDDLIFGVNFRDVVALRSSDGKQLWSFPIRLDPLSVPHADKEAQVSVLVDHNYVVHAVDSRSGEQLWAFPAEVENPRITMAAGMVLIDKRDDDYQVLLDARTGSPLPETVEPIVDLKDAGALMFIDGVATIVPAEELRNPAPPTPTTAEED
ncbi:MAG TPA: PQQ-binding-like beta-propeller repeat protein [Nocardioidaceae bacterium]|nr:PQQ-binding-like beta-propeller repeat protein [Nocardioidaceae bacterium]